MSRLRVRVIIEASDPRLYMTAPFIKASGLGVCAAPPVSDQQAAAQVIAQMQLTDLTNDDIAAATQLRRRAQLDIKHPQNTGLRMNQVTTTSSCCDSSPVGSTAPGVCECGRRTRGMWFGN